jgi:hypothetical protein
VNPLRGEFCNNVLWPYLVAPETSQLSPGNLTVCPGFLTLHPENLTGVPESFTFTLVRY